MGSLVIDISDDDTEVNVSEFDVHVDIFDVDSGSEFDEHDDKTFKEQENGSDYNNDNVFEFDEHEDKAYKELENGSHTIETTEGTFACPYCPGKRKDFLHKELLQHASGIGHCTSKRRTPQDKQHHLALERYLTNNLSNEESQPKTTSTEPIDDPPLGFDREGKFVWPWRGVVVNLPTVCVEGRNVGGSGSKLRHELKSRGYNPIRVHTLWNFKGHSGVAIVEFSKDWDGLHHAMLFEKAYMLDNHGKKDWCSCNGNGSGLYAWVARTDDYNDGGITGDHLRKVGDLKSIAEITEEEERKTSKLVENLNNVIESKYKDFEEIEAKVIETSLSLRQVLIEKDALHKYYEEDIRKIQLSARCHFGRIFDSHEALKQELESQRRDVEGSITELERRKARNESDRTMLSEEIEKNVLKNSSLQLAALEQEKADENVVNLAENQKREKEKLHKKIIDLEKKLDDRQTLELEIEKLKGELGVIKHMGDGGDEEVLKKVKEIHKVLKEKENELKDSEQLYRTLVVKERSNNDELQEARKELIEVFKSLPKGIKIGIKKMGEVDTEPFFEAAKRKFAATEAEEKAAELCSLWAEYLRDPGWHPFKVVMINGKEQELVNEDDEKLKALQSEWGDDAYRAVVISLMEMNQYNPSGRYAISELWNYVEGRRATLKEVLEYLLDLGGGCKRRRVI